MCVYIYIYTHKIGIDKNRAGVKPNNTNMPLRACTSAAACHLVEPLPGNTIQMTHKLISTLNNKHT